jgi:hypothetical protein
VTLLRVQRTTEVTLSHTFFVDEAATDPSDTVNVSIKRLDGTEVTTGPATQGTVGDGRYEFKLEEAHTQDLITYYADWSGTLAGALITVRDVVEVVGGFYFSIPEARASHPDLASSVTYTTADLQAKRIEVEQTCQAITGRSFVPRYNRVLMDGTGTECLILPDQDLRAVRSIKMAGRAGGTFTAFTTAEMGAVAALNSGVLCRDDGNVFTEGRQNVLVEYEYGLDMPPEGVRTQAMRHLRYLLNAGRSGIPDRAISFTIQDGGVYRISTPGEVRTGIPDVDAEYERHGLRVGGFA